MPILDLQSSRWQKLSPFGDPTTLVLLLQKLTDATEKNSTETIKLVQDMIIHQYEICPATLAAFPYFWQARTVIPGDDVEDYFITVGQIASSCFMAKNEAPADLFADFAQTCRLAEPECVSQIVSSRSGLRTLYYLSAAALALAGHRLGRLFQDNFFPDRRADTAAKCPRCNSLTRFACFEDGLVAFPPRAKYPEPPDISAELLQPRTVAEPARHPNPWRPVAELIAHVSQSRSGSAGLLENRNAALLAAASGVSHTMPTGQIFALIGGIIEAKTSGQAARRYYHANDRVRCAQCDVSFTFADHWYLL